MAQGINIEIKTGYDGSGAKDAEAANQKLVESLKKAADQVDANAVKERNAAEVKKMLAREQEKLAKIVDKSSEEYQKTARNVEVLKQSLSDLGGEGEKTGGILSKVQGIVGKMIPGFGKLGAAGATAFGAAIAAGYSLYKLYESLEKLAKVIWPKAEAADSLNAIKRLEDEAANFKKEMEESRKISKELTANFNAEVDAVNKLTKAQNDFNKAQEIAAAKTREERDAISRRYDELNAGADVDSRRRKIERGFEDLDAEENRITLEIRNAERTMKRANSERERLGKALADKYDSTGFLGYRTDATLKSLDSIGNAYTKARNLANEQPEIIEAKRKELEDVKARREILRKEQEAYEKTVEAEELNRATAEKDREAAAAEEKRKAAEKLAEDERKAAEKAEAARLKAVEEERKAREKMEADLHRQRIEDAKAEIAEAQKAQASVSGTASAARTEFDKAFAMYRDRELAARTIAEERDYAADYKQLGKDAARYGGKWRIDELAALMAAGDTQGQAAKLEEWRKSSRFTPEVEAMVRASAADQTRTTAEAELRKIAANTEGLAQKLDNLLAMK